jgi:hypothetical protein
VPALLYWWERPYMVAAHIFTDCPRLFREWAGVDFKALRSGSQRQAYRHTDGMCNHCLLTWRMSRAV